MEKLKRVIVCNRAPLASRDGWIHIVPKGELPNAQAGIVQVLDDEAMDAILAGIEKDKNRLGDRWPGLYAGREHFIYDETKDSAALAWFKDFQKRPDGIWAKDDGLTPAGRAAVTNREYKFTSFVSDPKQLEKLDGRRFRITGIETVGFTNQANGKEMLTPITNRALRPADRHDGRLCCPDCDYELSPTDQEGVMNCSQCQTNFACAGAPAAKEKETNPPKKMKNIATKLGLVADANEDSIVAAIGTLQNRVSTLEPLAEENKKLTNRLTELDAAAVDALLASRGVKDEKVLNRLKPIIAGTPVTERAQALEELGFKVPTAGAATPTAATRVLNRGTGITPAPATETDANAEQVRASKIRNRANALRKEGMNYDAAFVAATQEVDAK